MQHKRTNLLKTSQLLVLANSHPGLWMMQVGHYSPYIVAKITPVDHGGIVTTPVHVSALFQSDRHERSPLNSQGVLPRKKSTARLLLLHAVYFSRLTRPQRSGSGALANLHRIPS